MNNNNCKMVRLKAYLEIHEYKVLSESGIPREKPSEVVGFEQRLVKCNILRCLSFSNICEGPVWAGSGVS